MHLLIDKGRASKMTKVTMQVVNKDSEPVPRTSVGLIVSGEGISRHGEKTNDNGQATWSWTSERSNATADRGYVLSTDGEYQCFYRAGKGQLSDSGKLVLEQNKEYFLRVELERNLDAPGQASARYLQRNSYPMKDRSEQQLLEDVGFSFLVLEGLLETSSATLETMAWSVKNDLDFLEKARAEARSVQRSAKLNGNIDDLIKDLEKQKGALSAKTRGVSGASVVFDLLQGAYDVIDAVRNDDAEGVVKALGLTTLDIVLGLHPVTGAVWFAIKFVVGFRAAVAKTFHVSPEVASAIEMTSLIKSELKDFSQGIYCDPKQYRIDISSAKKPYPCKPASGPGLAFEKGSLVWVGARNETIRLRIRNSDDANQFLYFVRELQTAI